MPVKQEHEAVYRQTRTIQIAIREFAEKLDEMVDSPDLIDMSSISLDFAEVRDSLEESWDTLNRIVAVLEDPEAYDYYS